MESDEATGKVAEGDRRCGSEHKEKEKSVLAIMRQKL
jgi:hypothetical protein